MYVRHPQTVNGAIAAWNTADTPTKRRTRSANPTPHAPTSRSKDHVYSAPGSNATISTTNAWNVSGMPSR